MHDLEGPSCWILFLSLCLSLCPDPVQNGFARVQAWFNKLSPRQHVVLSVIFIVGAMETCGTIGVALLNMAGYTISLRHGLLYLPRAYEPTPDMSCRVYRQPGLFVQGDCGSCTAFAMSMAYGMRLCRRGIDALPSPYRLFDCAGLFPPLL